MKRIAFWISLWLLLPCVYSHAGSSPKTIRGVRTENPPLIDGKLDEPEWKTAPPVMDFTQYDPDEGARPTELTSVRILYDARTLYIGVICYDAHPELIVSQLSRRDRSTEADRFTVFIDSYNDRQTAFLFSVNVSGVQTDGVLSQDGLAYDVTWDAVWSSAARRHRDGWSVELAIPFAALRYADQGEGDYTWGLNLRRYISRKREVDEWVMTPRKDVLPGSISAVSTIGRLTGLRNIEPAQLVSLVPYVSGKATARKSEPGWRDGTTTGMTGGLDIKYGLARNFTLDATLNPDFGQVEVDQAVLNLTVFETQFPEKRPFFMEGAPLFVFGTSVDPVTLPLFFSRRIGRRPGGSAAVVAPPGGFLKENPEVTSILGAAKLSGRFDNGFSLGVISAATGEERAVVVDSAGRESSMTTEPRGSYNVLRWKQDFAGGSWLGGMATLVGRQSVIPAVSGGLDWSLRLVEGTYALEGYLAGAQSSADNRKVAGSAGKAVAGRIAAEHWIYLASYDFATPSFNCNDIGFFAQPHDEGGYLQVIYRENALDGFLHRFSLSVAPEGRWNWDHVRTKLHLQSYLYLEFQGFWTATLIHDYNPPSYDDAERGIVGIYRRPDDHAFTFTLNSDTRQRVSGSATAGYEFDVAKKHALTLALSLTARPASWLELVPVASYRRSRHEQAWLFPDGNIVDPAIGPSPFSVFGRRALDELDMELRGTVAFTSTFSFQFFSQVLLAKGRYTSYSRLTGQGKLMPYDYAGFAGFTSHDFNEATVNGNLLLRWEYLPGSVVYLVWTQQRYGDSGISTTSLGDRLGEVFSLPREDVFLLKITYWIPL